MDATVVDDEPEYTALPELVLIVELLPHVGQYDDEEPAEDHDTDERDVVLEPAEATVERCCPQVAQAKESVPRPVYVLLENVRAVLARAEPPPQVGQAVLGNRVAELVDP